MKTKVKLFGTGIVLTTVAGLVACSPARQPAAAPGDAALHEQVMGMVHVCSSCHGTDGNSVSPTFPKLAGQQKEYLMNQLHNFRDHTRADPHAKTYMFGMAAHLTDAEIDGLTTYFSSQRTAPGQTDNPPAEVAAGKALFFNGDPDHDVPACMACHGQNAEGNGQFPRLASQHREYLLEQLSNFATNVRSNDIMHQNAKPLTPAQARDLASYLSSL